MTATPRVLLDAPPTAVATVRGARSRDGHVRPRRPRRLRELHALLAPGHEESRAFAAYGIPPLSRIGCELLQSRLRKQARAFGLDRDLVAADVDRAVCVVRIDAPRMNALNARLSAAIDDDAFFRTGLLRRFHTARRRVTRARLAVEQVLRLGELPPPAALLAWFDAATTFQELGALKFGFPHEAVRTHFVTLLDGDDAAYELLRVPPGASLFHRLDALRLRLALLRETADAQRYARELAAALPRFASLYEDDVASDTISTATLDADVAATARTCAGIAGLRRALDAHAERRRERERARTAVLARIHARIGAARGERLRTVGLLALLELLAAHEDRNRSEKSRFLRAFATLCARLECDAAETGLLALLDALRAASTSPLPAAHRPPPLFVTAPEAHGLAAIQETRDRLTDVSALRARARTSRRVTNDTTGAQLVEVRELEGNLCDFLVRCRFDNGATVVGKAFLPVIKARPSLAFRGEFADRGRGIDRRMNRFAQRLPDARVRVPQAYGYDADLRVVWMQDVGAARPLAASDWPHALPALAEALAAVHAPGVGDATLRKLRDARRALYLIAHPATLLIRHLDSATRLRRWRRFLAADAAARRTLVHGDLCPKNIVVDDGGVLWLLDFDRANVASPAYDVGTFAAHLWIEGRSRVNAASADAAAGAGAGGAAAFLELYMHAAHADEEFAHRAGMYAALALAYRATTLDYIAAGGAGLERAIARCIGELLDSGEPWHALGTGS